MNNDIDFDTSVIDSIKKIDTDVLTSLNKANYLDRFKTTDCISNIFKEINGGDESIVNKINFLKESASKYIKQLETVKEPPDITEDNTKDNDKDSQNNSSNEEKEIFYQRRPSNHEGPTTEPEENEEKTNERTPQNQDGETTEEEGTTETRKKKSLAESVENLKDSETVHMYNKVPQNNGRSGSSQTNLDKINKEKVLLDIANMYENGITDKAMAKCCNDIMKNEITSLDDKSLLFLKNLVTVMGNKYQISLNPNNLKSVVSRLL